MKIKRMMRCFSILFLLFMVLGAKAVIYAQTNDDSVKIDFIYAPEKIRLGDIWKVYLSVTDPQGKMNRVFFQVKQPGGTDSYKPSFVYLKKGMEKQFTGHFALHTRTSVELGDLVLELTIVDRAGNTRKILSLPLEFGAAKPMKPFPPDLEKDLNQRVGVIDVDWDVSAD
jgi:hypothetical protein